MTNNNSILHITHIESNVKKGVLTDLALRTLIVGPNGSGKSSIINSVELALGGFATDIMGRAAMKKPGDLMVLSNDGKTLQVTAQLSDGSSASFATEKTRTGARRPIHVAPSTVAFHFLDVTNNLTGSGAKARTWFLQRIAGKLDLKTVIERFPPPLQEGYRSRALSLQKIQPHSSQVDMLIAIAESAAKKSRDSRTELKVLNNLRREMVKPEMTFPPTDNEIKVLQAQEAKALDTYREVSATSSSAAMLAQAKVRAVQAALDLQVAEGHHKTALNRYNSLPSDSDGSYRHYKLTEIRRALIPVLHLHVELDASKCLVCTQGSIDFVKRHAHLKQANAQAEELFSASDALTKAVKDVETKKENATKEVEFWTQLKSSSTTTSAALIEEVRSTYQAIMDERISAQREKATWDEISNMHDRIAETEEMEKASKEIAAECQGVIKRLLQSSIGDFEAKVQAYLPDGEVFGLEVNPKSDACRFGLRQGKILISALSGAEWARVVTAIGCATVNGSEFSLFVPEERAFDPVTLSQVMKALEAAPGQVLLTSTVLPKDPNSEWMIIDLSPSE